MANRPGIARKSLVLQSLRSFTAKLISAFRLKSEFPVESDTFTTLIGW
jgi:hypothetical protein